MYTVHVMIEGTRRGLLMSRFSPEAQMGIDNSKSTGRMSREGDAESRAYRLHTENGEAKGQLMLPAEHFLGAIVKSAVDYRIPGKGKKTFKDTVKGSLDIQPDYIGLTRNGEKLYNYGIDSRPVKIKATSGRIVRHRPFLEAGWQVDFDIEVSDNKLPVETLQSILAFAGESIGVADYRPRYGTFRIVEFKKF